MRSVKQAVKSLGQKYAQKCVSTPGKWNSCEPCKNCGRRARFPESGTPTPSCCGIPNPQIYFQPQSVTGGDLYTLPITINIDCQIEVCFTPYTTVGDFGWELLIFVNSSPIATTNDGNPVCILLNDNDELVFGLLGSGTKDYKCIEIYMDNITCNIANSIIAPSLCLYN